jgi:hypothetical protein
MNSCNICGTPFTKRRPNSCTKCYFKRRHKERYKNKPRKCISCGEMHLIGHNVYCDYCRQNILTCDKDHRIYFGRKFYKNELGYWVCCRSRQPWAHRWVWINEKGAIPKGLDVHHIDGDKDNNDISNLELMTRSDHQKKHWEQGDHEHEMELRKQTLAKHRKKKT